MNSFAIVRKIVCGMATLAVAVLMSPQSGSQAQAGLEPDAIPGALTYLPLVAGRVAPQDDADFVPAALTMRQILAQQLDVHPAAVLVLEVMAVDCPDSCLGAATLGEMCLTVITPGYRIDLRFGGDQYRYHTNTDGSSYRRAR